MRRSASVLPAQNFAITLNNKLHLFFLIISLTVVTSRQAPGTGKQSSSDRMIHSFVRSFIPQAIVVELLQSSKYWIRRCRFQRETSPGTWPDVARISRGRQLHTVKTQMLGNKCWEWRGKGLQPLPPGAGTQLSFPVCNGPRQKSQISY